MVLKNLMLRYILFGKRSYRRTTYSAERTKILLHLTRVVPFPFGVIAVFLAEEHETIEQGQVLVLVKKVWNIRLIHIPRLPRWNKVMSPSSKGFALHVDTTKAIPQGAFVLAPQAALVRPLHIRTITLATVWREECKVLFPSSFVVVEARAHPLPEFALVSEEFRLARRGRRFPKAALALPVAVRFQLLPS